MNRDIKLQRLAKKYVSIVRGSGYIHYIPDEIVDQIKDGEIEQFFNILRYYGLKQIPGKGWEDGR